MSGKQSSNKRRPRITHYQKTTLVSLVQNFFIRTVGHHSNVNFDEINGLNLERIASILNPMGAVKTGAQWKSTLYYMKNRIRKTVKQILQSGASPHDILSTLDLKIYEMISTDDFGVMGTSDDNANEGELNLENQPEQDSQDGWDDGTGNLGDANANEGGLNSGNQVEEDSQHGLDDGAGNLGEFHSESLEEKDEGYYYDNRTAYDDYPDSEIITKNEFEPEIDDVLEIDPVPEEEYSTDVTVVHSNRILVVESADELDAHIDSLIEEDAYEESSIHPEHNFPVGDSTASFTERPPSTHRPFSTDHLPSVGRTSSTSGTKLTPRTQSIGRPASNDRPPSVHQAPLIARPPSVDGSPFVKNKSTQNLNQQNSGKRRSTPSAKSSAKAKLADAHNGSGLGKSLTRLEEKIVSIYGMDSLDGQQTLGESGFNYKKTIPATATRQVTSEASNVDMEADVQATSTTADEIERNVLEDILREIRNESNADTDEMPPLNELDIRIPTSNVNRSNASATLQSGSVAARPSNPVAERQLGPGTARQSGIATTPDVQATSTTADEIERNILEDILREIRNESNADTDETPPLNELDIRIPTSNVNRSNASATLQSGSVAARPSNPVAARPSNPVAARPSNPVAERQLGPGTARQSGIATTRPPHIGAAHQSGHGADRQTHQSGHGAGRQTHQSGHGADRQINAGAGSQSGAGSGSGRQCGSGRHTTCVGNLANSCTGRPNSARRMFAPPLRARRNRRESECEYITNINQFFNDDTDEEEERNHRSTSSENRGGGTTTRDRSNLRNNQTSFQMVQRSITSQEQFIEDANRNHSEVMYLIDRNHVETVGMYNSLLSGIFDLGREYLNRH